MEKTIWLCRHGKTEWNLEGRKQGRKDSPLTEQGKVQAASLAILFSDRDGQLISSPLGRATHTAQYIHGKNPHLNLQIDERITEISFGDLEGLTSAEIDQRYPGIIREFIRDPFNVCFPNGESYRNLSERARRFLDDLSEYDVEEIIVVAHEDINRVLLSLLLDLPPENTIRILHPHNVIYRVRGKFVDCLEIGGSYISSGLLTGKIA